MEKLIDILDGLGAPAVLLVGDFMLDEYVYGDAERISPEAPVPVLNVVRREYRCGGAASVALGIAAMGGRVCCAGVIGQDPSGERLTAMLKDSGIDTAGLLRLADRPTTVKRRYIGLARHRHQQQLLRVDEENRGELPDEARGLLVEAIEKNLKNADVLGIEDYDKGVINEFFCANIAAARKTGKAVVVDPACIRNYGRYLGATLLTPNRYEAQLVTGIEIDDEAAMEAAAASILESTRAESVVITLDRQGAYCKSAGAPGRAIPTRPRGVYDVTGAGDVVMAMLTVATAGGCGLDQSAVLANIAGGLEVERFGVVPVTRDEIKDELRRMIGLRRSKIMGRDRLTAELERRRRDGQNIVFTNGCFDLLHMGHISYLQQAREQGSCLVVAINSDDSVRRLKGRGRPVIRQDERANMLAALECIDYVTIFEEDTPEPLLKTLRPEILVKGGSTGVIVGREIVEGYGGTVRRLDLIEGMSTSDIINHIVENHDEK